jgi:histidinol-phosphate phosphatase family protein
MNQRNNFDLKPALILDRDNTINQDEGYTYKLEDLVILPGVVEAIKMANDSGCYVFVASNQSGIARGFYSKEEAINFNNHLNISLSKFSAHIDRFEICEHLPNSGCICRKPSTKMLQNLYDEFPFNKTQSLMVGDKASDVECGEAFGIKSVLLKNSSNIELIIKEWLSCTYQKHP